MQKAFKKIQDFDPEAAIADRINGKREPIRSPGDFPVVNNHQKYIRHFTCDNEKDWTWDDNIKNSNPRRFSGSFILLSCKTAEDILYHSRVDIRRAFQGDFRIKRIQEMDTTLAYVVFGLHGDCHEESVAIDFRKHLIQSEGDLFEQKALFENDGIGFRDKAFDEAKNDE